MFTTEWEPDESRGSRPVLRGAKFPWSTHPYIRTKQGWLYLCWIYSAVVSSVGKSAIESIGVWCVSLCNGSSGVSNMVHSDQGSQYCSRDFRTLRITAFKVCHAGETVGIMRKLLSYIERSCGPWQCVCKEANTVLFDYIEIYYNRVIPQTAS